eukprot:2125833-Rhodomonas_salina.1
MAEISTHWHVRLSTCDLKPQRASGVVVRQFIHSCKRAGKHKLITRLRAAKSRSHAQRRLQVTAQVTRARCGIKPRL